MNQVPSDDVINKDGVKDVIFDFLLFYFNSILPISFGISGYANKQKALKIIIRGTPHIIFCIFHLCKMLRPK